jgi:hypothetical protein
MEMKMEWTRFFPELGSKQKLPPEKRYVLVMLPGYEEAGVASSCLVGWLKFAAGDKNCPYFVTPSAWVNSPHYLQPKPAYAWCDCLGDDFHAPLWMAGQSGRIEMPDDLDEVNA